MSAGAGLSPGSVSNSQQKILDALPGWGCSSPVVASRDDDQAEQQPKEEQAPEPELPSLHSSHTSPPLQPSGGSPDTGPGPRPGISPLAVVTSPLLVAVVTSPLLVAVGATLSPASPSWQPPLTQLPSQEATDGCTPAESLEASAAASLASPPRSVDRSVPAGHGLQYLPASAELPSWGAVEPFTQAEGLSQPATMGFTQAMDSFDCTLASGSDPFCSFASAEQSPPSIPASGQLPLGNSLRAAEEERGAPPAEGGTGPHITAELNRGTISGGQVQGDAQVVVVGPVPAVEYGQPSNATVPISDRNVEVAGAGDAPVIEGGMKHEEGEKSARHVGVAGGAGAAARALWRTPLSSLRELVFRRQPPHAAPQVTPKSISWPPQALSAKQAASPIHSVVVPPPHSTGTAAAAAAAVTEEGVTKGVGNTGGKRKEPSDSSTLGRAVPGAAAATLSAATVAVVRIADSRRGGLGLPLGTKGGRFPSAVLSTERADGSAAMDRRAKRPRTGMAIMLEYFGHPADFFD